MNSKYFVQIISGAKVQQKSHIRKCMQDFFDILDISHRFFAKNSANLSQGMRFLDSPWPAGAVKPPS